MKNYFRRAQAALTAPQVITAERVQREIVEAQDALVSEARSIIDAPRRDADSADRLAALGFISSKEVARVAEERARVRSAEVVRLAEVNANLKFPGMKFVSTAAMEGVCAKYGLVVGGVERYLGEVPEWALTAIERSGAARVEHGYEFGYSVLRGGSGSWSFVPCPGVGEADARVRAEDMDRFSRKNGGGPFGHLDYRYAAKSNLLIAAPIAEMRLDKRERVERGRIVRVRVQDPIVCVEVEGGYAVIVAWGEEGQDPGVFNAPSN